MEKSRVIAELRQQQLEEQRSGLDAITADDASWAEPSNLGSSSFASGGASSSTAPSQRDTVDAEDGGISQSLNEQDRQMEILKAANTARKAAELAKKVEKEEARLKGRFATTIKVLGVSLPVVKLQVRHRSTKVHLDSLEVNIYIYVLISHRAYRCCGGGGARLFSNGHDDYMRSITCAVHLASLLCPTPISPAYPDILLVVMM